VGLSRVCMFSWGLLGFMILCVFMLVFVGVCWCLCAFVDFLWFIFVSRVLLVLLVGIGFCVFVF